MSPTRSSNSATSAATKSRPPRPAGAPRMTILIADDNATNRKLLRLLLDMEGHEVLEADNGATALAVLEQRRVDAVISDILMPEMDGFRLCYKIRKHPRLKHRHSSS